MEWKLHSFIIFYRHLLILFIILTGPSILEVFNTLLRHLRISVETVLSEGQKANEEKHFQEAVIRTIG